MHCPIFDTLNSYYIRVTQPQSVAEQASRKNCKKTKSGSREPPSRKTLPKYKGYLSVRKSMA
jgi:hypothetical protein